MNKSSALLKGMFYVLIANVINMVFNLITNFILPKYLSIDSYAAIKTYQLYISYIGALHFGFTDGMYLKYGGKNLKEINPFDLSKNIGTLRTIEIFVATLLIVFSVTTHNTVLLFFSLTIVPTNVANYFTSLYQATGEFNKYGKIINFTVFVNCAINIILIFVFHNDNYSLFLLGYLIVNTIVWIYLESSLHSSIEIKSNIFTFDKLELLSNCKSGIVLMIGNLSSFILTGLDRWCVKFLMTSASFAFFSFAVSMESFLNVAMNPITVTLYNYFCNHDDRNQIIRVRNLVLIFSAVIIVAAFPAKFILEVYLDKYLPATMVMFFLFATQIFNMLNKGIYINLYKARRMQRRYFIKLIIVIISGLVFNIICYSLYKQIEAFAVGTLLSSLLWFILSKDDFKEYSYKLNEYIYMGLTIIVFLVCGYYLNSILGLLVYTIYAVIACFILMHSDFMFAITELIIPMAKKFLNKAKKAN